MLLQTSNIKDFFKNQTVFLTGGSGFLGKILIEKLLRECEDVKKIFVLIRTKKNKSSKERFAELFNYPCFDVLKSKNLDALQKVQLISGDCQEERLGISDEDVKRLVQETTCVIHAAASVKFDQSLKEATYNVRATRDLLDLAKEMPELKVFVHVSTAYSNCLYSHIKEDFYDPPMKCENLLSLVDAVDDNILTSITPRLLGKWPNTYIFTKSISEHLVKLASDSLPVTIVRPAIVTSSMAEPIPGWIDNFYGVVGIVAGAALGVLRSLNAKHDARAPLVPVDYVSNCVLAASWKRGTSSGTTIYNYVGHKKNTLTWIQFMKTIEVHCWNAASEKILWYYCFKLRENPVWHKICVFFLHTVQAYIVDFVLVLLNRKPIAVTNYKKINKLLDLISYFSTRDWEFDDNNVMQLWAEMSDEDKKLFSFDMENLDWDYYGHHSTLGARLYLLKDTPDTIDRGHRKIKILFVLHYTVVAILWFLLYKFLMFVLGCFF